MVIYTVVVIVVVVVVGWLYNFFCSAPKRQSIAGAC